MFDIIGVQLDKDHKDLVRRAVTHYRMSDVVLTLGETRTLSEIQLHLENEDSSLVFLEDIRLRINMEDHLDLLEIPGGVER